jgi:patatin-related protein
MREKELRIALVCFGGVSLAVYEHGVSKELLKLVRASRALHAGRFGAAARAAWEPGADDPRDPEYDTEPLWYDLLRDIGQTTGLRVIVDIIAGASAGGINGVLLARALAQDLPVKALRDLWLERGDIEVLLAAEARAGTFSKAFMRPFLWAAAHLKRIADIADPEVRRKLSLFVRSRWFKPPFDGRRMTEFMLDAVLSMGASPEPSRSLLPAGHPLELFVTLTDHYGYRRSVEIHDPPFIDEREHQRVLRFSHLRHAGGEIETDFDISDAPGLAFAARATSSFPGAFPPARLAELDQCLAARGMAWANRRRFAARTFDAADGAADPEGACFVDGGVLNNKPFHAALRAVRRRAAQRQVDRRLVYIDPDPEPMAAASADPPGFFATLKGALSDIPRNEPIAAELARINDHNDRVRRLRTIVDAARPHVTDLVSEVVPAEAGAAIAVPEIAAWRVAASARAARAAGFAYEGYVRLKLATVRAQAARLLAGLVGLAPGSPGARLVVDAVDVWAERSGRGYARTGSYADGGDMNAGAPDAPRWVRFLLDFDIEFRKRRLHFLISGLNRIYEPLAESAARPLLDAVNALKRDFHGQLEALRRRERPAFFSAKVQAAAAALFAGLARGGVERRDTAWVADFVAREAGTLDALADRMAAELRLDIATDALDASHAAIDPGLWPADARRDALVNYLGFPFWDVLTLSLTNWRDAAEFDEILVDRISPLDAKTLAALAAPVALKGTGLMHFAAFFSRAYREHDYLLGRLQAADRLFDILCDCAAAAAPPARALRHLKRRVFERILDTESPHLPNSPTLVAALRRAVSALD